MGNVKSNKMTTSQAPEKKDLKIYEPVSTFKFHDPFPEDTNNGLYLNDFYLPEEVISSILSYLEPNQLLRASEVCKKWCNIIKSDSFWAHIYSRQYRKKPKKLPWYVYYCALASKYFDTNLIKNGNGQQQYLHWKVIVNYGDQFRIEDPPCGADPLPLDVPEFNGRTGCFATSYYECNKLQEIIFEESRLMQLILDRFKPHIYVSEWTAGRFDCGSVYSLWCKLYGAGESKSPKKEVLNRLRYDIPHDEYDYDDEEDASEEPLHVQTETRKVEQWEGSTWSKVELLVKDYPPGVKKIVFQHEGRDTQFWKGHYGSKMAGGVVKIVFDSIEPLD